MKLEVGRVLSTSWTMIKQRFWLLCAMWLVYLAIQMVYSTVMGGFIGGSMLVFGMAGAGMDSPEALLGGLGIGVMVVMILFYIGYIVVAFAQQAAMVALGSPIEKPAFGDALSAGLKAGLTLLGVTVLVVGAYLVLIVGIALLSLVLSFMGDAGPVLASLIFLPAMIYLGLRFVVVVPVVVIEKFFNPIAAVRRSWQITGGKVLGIFLVMLANVAIAVVMLGIPVLIVFGTFGAIGAGAGDPDPAMAIAAFGTVIGALLLFFPLFLIYSIVSVVINACLHAELTDSETSRLEATFS